MLFEYFRKKTKTEQLKIVEDKIKTLSEEEADMVRENYLYIQSFNFEKHLKKLTEKLRNKSIILYGAGSYL